MLERRQRELALKEDTPDRVFEKLREDASRMGLNGESLVSLLKLFEASPDCPRRVQTLLAGNPLRIGDVITWPRVSVKFGF